MSGATIKVYVRDAESGNRIEMDVKNSNTVEDVIVSAASYWSKDPGAYVLRQGKRILTGEAVVGSLGLIDEDVLELMPDPEGGAGPGEARSAGRRKGHPSPGR